MISSIPNLWLRRGLIILVIPFAPILYLLFVAFYGLCYETLPAIRGMLGDIRSAWRRRT